MSYTPPLEPSVSGQDLFFFYFTPFECPLYQIFRSYHAARDISGQNLDEIGDLIMISPLGVTEMSETLVSRLRLRPGWSQGRSQALRPPAKSLSISLKI